MFEYEGFTACSPDVPSRGDNIGLIERFMSSDAEAASRDMGNAKKAESKQVTLVKAVKNLGYADSMTVARRGRMLYLVKKEG